MLSQLRRQAGRGLVQTAGPGDPVTGAIFNDAGFLVEDGVVMNRLAVDVAGHRDLHIEVAAGDHSGQ